MQLYDHGPELHLQRRVFAVAVIITDHESGSGSGPQKKGKLVLQCPPGRAKRHRGANQPQQSPAPTAGRVRVPHGTTAPRHRPTNPAVGRPPIGRRGPGPSRPLTEPGAETRRVPQAAAGRAAGAGMGAASGWRAARRRGAAASYSATFSWWETSSSSHSHSSSADVWTRQQRTR